MAISGIQEHSLLGASTLILTPKDEFKTWLKETAVKQKIFPGQIDREVTPEVLEDHALAFITPMLISRADSQKFYYENDARIFDLLLATWPFPLKMWPGDRTHQSLIELFDASYYLYLINIIDSETPASKASNTECSVTILKPKAKIMDWLDHLTQEKKINLPNIEKMDINALRKIGIAFLTPCFKNTEEKNRFLKNHYEKILAMGLSLYCNDQSHWPKGMTYESFLEWFDCVNYYPAISLLPDL